MQGERVKEERRRVGEWVSGREMDHLPGGVMGAMGAMGAMDGLKVDA